MRATLALLLLVACDKSQEYKVEPVDSTPVEGEEPDLDGDGYSELAGDCDDGDAAVHPGAEDACDAVDNDCDGETDEDATETTWFPDQDGDGFGHDHGEMTSCAQPAGMVSDSSDCNDHDELAYPDATEFCNGMDDDCDGEADESDAMDPLPWYGDMDEDGYGSLEDVVETCFPPAGYLADASDCDDGDAAVNPSAAELCDEIDNDCDGTVDEDDALDALDWYYDEDADGYGDSEFYTYACTVPSGYVDDASDCDDASFDVNPGAIEMCDEVDNDCDGDSDESDAADATIWYADSDEDGYGDALISETSCEAVASYVDTASDCDDADSEIPGSWSFAPNLIMVGFEDGDFPTDDILNVGSHILFRIASFSEINVGLYLIPDELGPCGAIALAEEEPGVAYADLDMEIETHAEPIQPDDPYYDYNNDSVANALWSPLAQWNLKILGLSAAWGCSTGDGARIAIIDSGIMPNSMNFDPVNDLSSSPMRCGYEGSEHICNTYYLDTDGDCTTKGDQCDITLGCTSSIAAACSSDSTFYVSSHGTYVAGIASQTTNNGIGIAGIAYDASVTSFRVYGTTGPYSDAWVAAYLNAAKDADGDGKADNFDVINDSNGASRTLNSDGTVWINQSTLAAVKYAISKGIFVATSSGNDNSNGLEGWKEYLSTTGGDADGFVVVGSVGVDSSTGIVTRATGTSGSNYGTGLALVAPGASIMSSCYPTTGSSDTDAANMRAHCLTGGTSAASPHVAGSAALMMAAGATNVQAEQFLRDTAAKDSDGIRAGGYSFTAWNVSEYGSGIIQPGAALNSLLGSDAGCVVEDANIPHLASGSSGPVECAAEGKTLTRLNRFASPSIWIKDFAAAYVDGEDELFVIDVNGDTRADAVFFNASVGTWEVAISGGCDGSNNFTYNDSTDCDGDGSTGPLWDDLTSFGESCGSGASLVQALMGDPSSPDGTLLGDGAADAVIYCSDGDWWVSPSNGGGTPSGNFRGYARLATGLGATADCTETPIGFLGTLTSGLGLYDATAFPVSFCDGTWRTAYGATVSSTLVLCGFGDEDGTSEAWVQSFLHDVDGDGRSDYVVFSDDGDWHVWLGGDESCTDDYSSVWVSGSADWADAVFLGDVNNDRTADIVAVYRDDDNSLTRSESECEVDDGTVCGAHDSYDCDGDFDGVWSVGLGDGDAETFDETAFEEGQCMDSSDDPWLDDMGAWGAGAERFFVADVDGDGYDDAIAYYSTSGDSEGVWKVALSGVYECE